MISDCIFQEIERIQEDSGRPWKRFLDAGTGVHSLKWVCSLETESWVALTAAMQMAESIYAQNDITLKMREVDNIAIGNWDDEALLYGQQFETVLADYLVGAMDGFSPYKQDLIFERLKRHIAPGGRLYIVGLEPIPESAEGPANVICEVVRLRDSCIKLAGHRCYREYPLEWIQRQLLKSGYRIISTHKMPIVYSFDNIKRQINVASSKLPFFPNEDLKTAMKAHIESVTHQVQEAVDSTTSKRIKLGFDYIVCAEPVDYVLIPPSLNIEPSPAENNIN